MSEQDRTDRELMAALARWLRTHDCLAFDDLAAFDEQVRAETLVQWFADAMDTLNVPPREAE